MEDERGAPADRLWFALWFLLMAGVAIYLGSRAANAGIRWPAMGLGVVLAFVAVGLYWMDEWARRLGGALSVLIAVGGVVQIALVGTSRGPLLRTGFAVWAAWSLLSPGTRARFANGRRSGASLLQFIPILVYPILGVSLFIGMKTLRAPQWQFITVAVVVLGLYAGWGEDRFQALLSGRTWIDGVLDAIEEDGLIAVFLLQSRMPERFEALSAKDCRRIVARLETVVQDPPSEESVSDPFRSVASLLDKPGMPVELDALHALLARIPPGHRVRREAIYRALGRIRTRGSLNLLMRHVAANPSDPALADIGSALVTIEREPTERDVLFPRLATLLGRADCASQVMGVANAFKEPPHPLADRAEDVRRWLLQEEDVGTRARAAWTLGLMGDKPAADALCAAMESPDRQLSTEAAQALVRIGDPRGAAAIAKLCGDARTRWRAVAYAREMGREDLVTSECLQPVIRAEDAMREWLEHPNEYGKPPDEVELLDASSRRWPVKGIVDCWLFRYRYGEEWNVGMTGPLTFSLDGTKLLDRPVELIYQAYEEWDQNPNRGLPAIQKLAEKVLGESKEQRSKE